MRWSPASCSRWLPCLGADLRHADVDGDLLPAREGVVRRVGFALWEHRLDVRAGDDAESDRVGFDLSDGYHTYGVNWQEDSITWYIDGKEFHRSANRTHTPMYVILNLAVGGTFVGPPNASTDWHPTGPARAARTRPSYLSSRRTTSSFT